MTNDKIEDSDSSASTLKPPPTFSQRPTLRIIVQPPIEKQHAPIRYKFYLIGVIIVAVIICAIILITKPLQSYSMPKRHVFNLSPIAIPTDSTQPKIEITPIVPEPSNSAKTPELKSIPQLKKPIQIKSKDKDYGIDDLINPYEERIIYKL